RLPHHAGAGVVFLARHAGHDRPGRFARDLAGHHDRAGLGLLLGDAAADRAVLGHLPGDHLVDRHLAGDGPALADALHRGAGDFNPGWARHPDLDRLRPRARLAAAVVLLAAALDAVPHARAAGHFLALVVAAVHALASHGRDRLAGDEGLHDR